MSKVNWEHMILFKIQEKKKMLELPVRNIQCSRLFDSEVTIGESYIKFAAELLFQVFGIFEISLLKTIVSFS